MTVTQSPRWKAGVLSAALQAQIPLAKPAGSDSQDQPYLTPTGRGSQSSVAQRNYRSKRITKTRGDDLKIALGASHKQRSRSAKLAGGKAKTQIGDVLVDTATDLIVGTWPSPIVSRDMVRHFISEAVRRSCTSYALLQLAVYYVSMAREWADFRRKDDPHALDNCPTLGCGRRVFLAALVVAHKYHIDRSFGATAWSKISCLPAKQIVAMELDLLKALEWKVHVPYLKFADWCQTALAVPSLLVAKPGSDNAEVVPTATFANVQMPTPDNSPVS